VIETHEGRKIVVGVHSIHDINLNALDNAIQLFEEGEENNEDAKPVQELFGNWEKGDDGIYNCPETSKFSAIYNCCLATVQVIHSNYAVRCKRCSPCYPNQGDVDVDGDEYIAYILPPEHILMHWILENGHRVIKLEGGKE